MANDSDNVERDTMCKTIISKFRDRFDLEQPDKISEVIQETLETIASQKADAGFFLNEIRRATLQELTAYRGDNSETAEKSTAITVAELAVHWFSLKYNPEQPAKARQLVNRTVAYLQRLQEQGYGDMRRFYADILHVALKRSREYDGEHPLQASESVVHVYDEVTRKTSYYSNKRKGKTTRKIRKK